MPASDIRLVPERYFESAASTELSNRHMPAFNTTIIWGQSGSAATTTFIKDAPLQATNCVTRMVFIKDWLDQMWVAIRSELRQRPSPIEVRCFPADLDEQTSCGIASNRAPAIDCFEADETTLRLMSEAHDQVEKDIEAEYDEDRSCRLWVRE